MKRSSLQSFVPQTIAALVPRQNLDSISTTIKKDKQVTAERVLPGHELASMMPAEASFMYGNNIAAFVDLFVTEGAVTLDLDDEVVAGALLTHDGEVAHARTAELLRGEGR